MKIFVDTNIFLDLILKRESFHEALVLFNGVEKKLFTGVVLDITLLNIDYVAKKQVKEIREFIQLINEHFIVVGASNEMMREALALGGNDLEDNLQYIAAKEMLCSYIVTNDAAFYAKDIPTLSSKAFVEERL